MDYAASTFEIKSLTETGAVEGLLAGFGNVDHGGDRLLPGCLTKSLAGRATPLPMLLHHDLERPIGSWKEWREEGDGLFVKGAMTLTTRDGQEAYALAKDGALTGLSIGWKPVKAAAARDGVRTIAEAEIFEGSLVSVPMNERARVTSIKSITGPRDIADLLREAGLSGRKAKFAAGAAWKTITGMTNDEAEEAEIAAILNASAARIRAMKGKDT